MKAFLCLGTAFKLEKNIFKYDDLIMKMVKNIERYMFMIK